MNRITGMLLTALGVAVIGQAAWAQSNCKEAKGNLIESFNPTIFASTGTLSNGGWLDGTTLAAFNSGVFPTPSPTQVTFGGLFTLTTIQGQLKGSATYLLDFVTGQGASVIKIDPGSSTGLFAGATGVLILNLLHSDTVAFGPYHEEVVGQVCFAQ